MYFKSNTDVGNFVRQLYNSTVKEIAEFKVNGKTSTLEEMFLNNDKGKKQQFFADMAVYSKNKFISFYYHFCYHCFIYRTFRIFLSSKCGKDNPFHIEGDEHTEDLQKLFLSSLVQHCPTNDKTKFMSVPFERESTLAVGLFYTIGNFLFLFLFLFLLFLDC